MNATAVLGEGGRQVVIECECQAKACGPPLTKEH